MECKFEAKFIRQTHLPAEQFIRSWDWREKSLNWNMWTDNADFSFEYKAMDGEFAFLFNSVVWNFLNPFAGRENLRGFEFFRDAIKANIFYLL